MTASTEEEISVYFVLFSALLAGVLVLSKMLHQRPRLARILPEAGMVLLVGLVFGAMLSLLLPSTTSGSGNSSNGSSGNDGQDDAVNNNNDDNAAQGAEAVDEEVAESLLSFSDEVFFLFLLPPIIFNSGYHLRKELFFRHITPIALLAVLGTTVSALVIAFFLDFVNDMGWMDGRQDFRPAFSELLTFGALISATDPVSTLAVFQEKRVDPQLFYLVFGESVLNDAVGLVLFNSFKKFVVVKDNAGKVVIDLGEFFLGFFYDSVCSPALGLAVGILAAVVFKWADMRDTKLLELSLFVLIMYVPFLVAEMLDLSGIVTILFTGMTARAYVVPNLSDETAENANTLFRLAAHLAETSIFLELGLSAFGMKGSVYGTFIGWCLVACLLGRALNVYPIVYLYNQYLRQHGGQHERLDTSQNDNRQRMSSSNHEQPDSVEMTTMQSRSHDSADSTSRSMDCPLSQDDSQDTADLSHFRGMVKDDLEISWNTAHMLWFSGLRGAVAYACVRSFPDTFHHQEIFTVTTMCIVLVTVFGLGSTTESTLNLLRIEMDVNEDQYMEVWHQEQSEDGLIVSVEERLKQYAIRTTTPIAIHAEDDHDTSMAPGEASIATGFRHHRDADGAVGTDPSLHHRGRRKPGDSVFDFGKR